MFVGHDAPALLARRAEPSVPLWVWFVGVQWLDLFFMVFVLTGIERMQIVPGFTQANDLDLYWMPYTHSLIGSLAFSLLFAGLTALVLPAARTGKAMALLAAASFSHWILDYLVHTPDLSLFDPETKVGLGLWNHLAVELPLELILVAGCAWLYAQTAESKARRRIWILAAVMLVLQVYSTFGPTPTSTTAFALTGLLAYVVLILGARWVERP